MFAFPCPTSWQPEQLAYVGMKKLRHCQPMAFLILKFWSLNTKLANRSRVSGRTRRRAATINVTRTYWSPLNSDILYIPAEVGVGDPMGGRSPTLAWTAPTIKIYFPGRHRQRRGKGNKQTTERLTVNVIYLNSEIPAGMIEESVPLKRWPNTSIRRIFSVRYDVLDTRLSPVEF